MSVLHWIVKPVSLLELSVQFRKTTSVDPDLTELAVRPLGAAGGVGVTLFEEADAAPVPNAFVAFTVNV